MLPYVEEPLILTANEMTKNQYFIVFIHLCEVTLNLIERIVESGTYHFVNAKIKYVGRDKTHNQPTNRHAVRGNFLQTKN